MSWQDRQNGRPAGDAQDRWFAYSDEYQTEKAIGKDVRMLHDALRRWATQPRKDRAMEIVEAGLDCDNLKVRLMAARCVILMEKQNQFDDIKGQKAALLQSVKRSRGNTGGGQDQQP